MKLLTRNISAYRFMTLGGLVAHKSLPKIKNSKISNFDERDYPRKSFGYSEDNVEKYLIKLLKQLGWKDVNKDHDILATSGEDSLLIECKTRNPKLIYLDEHKGGSPGEMVVQQLHRNLRRHGLKWGLISDGVDFRLYYNDKRDPSICESYIEFNFGDIIDSGHRWPEEAHMLFDILSPQSVIRKIDPRKNDSMSGKDIKRIVETIEENKSSLHFILKSLAVAALEDMGIRQMHRRVKSIKNVFNKEEYLEIFNSIESADPDFQIGNDQITKKSASDINSMFKSLSHIDFAHVDHEFFGLVYQKYINNGNASHYTNTAISKEMAEYIAGRSQKQQEKRKNRKFRTLEENDLIVDPAVGSGQLLRGLLPFHSVFFHGATHGIDGWRRLARHLSGRDIDGDAIFVAKLNIWLATAKSNACLVDLSKFRELNVIKTSIARRGGETINDALQIGDDFRIAACVTNPPWDVFKKYKGKNENVTQEDIDKVKTSLNLKVRPLNRAQIFLKILLMMCEEKKNSDLRFSIILPDSFFIDQNQNLRDLAEKKIEFYFSYPRNSDPKTKKRIFEDIDRTRKFGIIFGRSGQTFKQTYCYPLGQSKKIRITRNLSNIGKFRVLPLLSHPIQAAVISHWKRNVKRRPAWHDGEFNQGTWNNAKKKTRTESKTGKYYVIKGDSFTDKDSAFSRRPGKTPYWKRMSALGELDKKKRKSNRVIFSDYLNNSKKVNSATYLPGSKGLNLVDLVLYSMECVSTDWMIYDSLVFSPIVEMYASSQHMNSWRMSALGLPLPIKVGRGGRKYQWLLTTIKLVQSMGLSVKQALTLYDLYSEWMSLLISRDGFKILLESRPASVKTIEKLLAKIEKIEKALEAKRVKKIS